jgi:hypothetical protein
MTTSTSTTSTSTTEPKEFRFAEPKPFYGLDNEDPAAWLELFHKCARVNRWTDWTRKKDFISFLLRDEAYEWFKTFETLHPTYTETQFDALFKEK